MNWELLLKPQLIALREREGETVENSWWVVWMQGINYQGDNE